MKVRKIETKKSKIKVDFTIFKRVVKLVPLKKVSLSSSKFHTKNIDGEALPTEQKK